MAALGAAQSGTGGLAVDLAGFPRAAAGWPVSRWYLGGVLAVAGGHGAGRPGALARLAGAGASAANAKPGFARFAGSGQAVAPTALAGTEASARTKVLASARAALEAAVGKQHSGFQRLAAGGAALAWPVGVTECTRSAA